MANEPQRTSAGRLPSSLASTVSNFRLTEKCFILRVTGNIRGTLSRLRERLNHWRDSYQEENNFARIFLDKNPFWFLLLVGTVTISERNGRNELAMTTGIISLVLIVLMASVMYFVMKIYSVLRGFEHSFHQVHDIEMDAATKQTKLHGGVALRQRQTVNLMADCFPVAFKFYRSFCYYFLFSGSLFKEFIALKWELLRTKSNHLEA